MLQFRLFALVELRSMIDIMRVNHDYFRTRDSCPACAGRETEILFSTAMDASPARDLITSHFSRQGMIDWGMLRGTDFRLSQCLACSTIYQVAEPNERLLNEIYTRMIDPAFLAPFEQAQLTVNRFNDIAGEIALLFEMTGKPAGSVTFLDFGAGYCSWARVARAMGATVYVTEIGDAKAEAAAALGVTMLADADIDSMRFDIVHTEQVFEHLPRPRETFARLAAVTKGVLKVAVPPSGRIAGVLRRKGLTKQSPFDRMLDGGPRQRDDPVYMAIQPLEHLNIFSRRSMEVLARDYRMRIVSRTRRQIVPFDLTTWRGFVRSNVKLVKAVANETFRFDTGYTLFRPLREP